MPPTLILAMPTAKITATTGMISAGTNSQLPNRSAPARCCSGLGPDAVPRASWRVPTRAAMPRTAMPRIQAGAVFATTNVP